MSQRIARRGSTRGADRVDRLVDRPRELARRLLDRPRRAHDRRALATEVRRQSLADAPRGAGHHDHLAVERTSCHPGILARAVIGSEVRSIYDARMAEITDEYMFEMLAQSKDYTLVLLEAGPNYADPSSPPIIFEHGRRNFSLRADGVLSIVCRVADDSKWSGIGVFNAPVDEVTRIMDGDPGVQAGVFTYEVHPVKSFPGDALPA